MQFISMRHAVRRTAWKGNHVMGQWAESREDSEDTDITSCSALLATGTESDGHLRPCFLFCKVRMRNLTCLLKRLFWGWQEDIIHETPFSAIFDVYLLRVWRGWWYECSLCICWSTFLVWFEERTLFIVSKCFDIWMTQWMWSRHHTACHIVSA